MVCIVSRHLKLAFIPWLSWNGILNDVPPCTPLHPNTEMERTWESYNLNILKNVIFENLVSYLVVDAKILFAVICRFLVPQLNKEIFMIKQ